MKRVKLTTSKECVLIMCEYCAEVFEVDEADSEKFPTKSLGFNSKTGKPAAIITHFICPHCNKESFITVIGDQLPFNIVRKQNIEIMEEY